MATANYSKAYADYMNERNEINRKATLDSLLNGLNQNIANANSQIEDSNNYYNRLITENANATANKRADLAKQYENLINQVQVEKYKSPRQYKERYANMFGGGDNGLSRTNALFNNIQYDNKTADLRNNRVRDLNDLANTSAATEQSYRDAMRNYEQTLRNNILGYQSDYNNNVARVNAQYDSNILPWYDDAADTYYFNGSSYSGGGGGGSTYSPNYKSSLSAGKKSGGKNIATGKLGSDIARSIANNSRPHYSILNGSGGVTGKLSRKDLLK